MTRTQCLPFVLFALCLAGPSCSPKPPDKPIGPLACTDTECRDKYKVKHKHKERSIYILLQISSGRCTPFAGDNKVKAFPADTIVWEVENRCGTNESVENKVSFEFVAPKSSADPFADAVKEGKIKQSKTKLIKFKLKDEDALAGTFGYTIKVENGGEKDPEIEIEGI